MKNYYSLVAMLVLVFFVGISTGCDNKSQLEKDADKAASKLKGSMK